MAKLEQQPRLSSVASDVVEWARRVVGAVNPLIDAIGSIRTGTSDVTTTLDGPAFIVYRNAALSLSAGVETVIAFDTKVKDTANAYDPATGRFQPQVAGFYQLNASVQVGTGGQPITNFQLGFWLNGAMNARPCIQLFGAPTFSTVWGSALIYLNGSTDYVDVRVLSITTGTPSVSGGQTANGFSGHLARRA